MRLAISSLAWLMACGASVTRIDTREPAQPPVAPGEQREDDAPLASTALTFDIGPAEGCAVSGRQLWCWGGLSPADAGEAAAVPGLALGDPQARLVVKEGTACVIDQGALRCLGALTEEQRDRQLEALEQSGAPVAEVVAVEEGPFVTMFARDVQDVAIAISGLCWVRLDGNVGCYALDGETGAFSLPAPVDDARRIAMTDEHICVVRAGGSVACWGVDAAGVGGEVEGDRAVMHEGLEAVDVVAGLGFTCALSREGAVTCWGEGLLDESLFPVDAADERFAEYTWPAVRAVELVAGEFHACARTEGGQVWCVGENDVGQLGDGTTRHRPAPVRATELSGASALAATLRSTCVAVGERLRCVGDGTQGTFDGRRYGRRWERVFTGARQLVMNRQGTLICAVDEQDRLSCVGSTSIDGGLLEAIQRRLPEGVPPTARAFAHFDGARCWLLVGGRFECAPSRRAPDARDGVAEVEAGLRTLCVRHGDGSVVCRGASHANSSVVQGEGWQPMADFANAVDISVDDIGTSLCAALRNGRVLCRGTVQLGELTAVRDAVAVETSGSAVCARSRNGTLRCARSGAGPTTREDVQQVVFYDLHPCSLLSDGGLDCRERGAHALPPPATDLVQIAGSRTALCALDRTGQVHCYGRGLAGELGIVPPGVAIEARTIDPFAPTD